MNVLKKLNTMSEGEARATLEKCCGSSQWVEQMLALRPFADMPALLAAADEIWAKLGEADWLEAFRHHPKIGDVESLRKKFASTATWASGEQSGVNAADDDVLRGLAQGNDAYEKKFGFIFIVCATGKSAAEMLALLNARLPNDRAMELKNAAAEQGKITAIRLNKLAESLT